MKEFTKKYLEQINGRFSGLNLTALKDFESCHLKQTVDSLLPIEHSAKFRADLDKSPFIVDLGFGGGFPILPMAYKYGDKKFIGVDSTLKKVNAVQEIANSIGLKNVTTIHGRIEDVDFVSGGIVVLKAVGSVKKILDFIDFAPKGLKVYFYKGPKFDEEESKEIETIKNNWDMIEKQNYSLENGDERFIVGFESKNVPRGTKNKKINISEYLS